VFVLSHDDYATAFGAACDALRRAQRINWAYEVVMEQH
jgi:hypothetical protein